MKLEKIAPVQGHSPGIPWSLHVRAWNAYSAKYGKQQSAERIAERGGFSASELDIFVPGWRRYDVSEITKARISEVEAERDTLAAGYDRLMGVIYDELSYAEIYQALKTSEARVKELENTTHCPNCGPDVRLDEDACRAGCGWERAEVVK